MDTRMKLALYPGTFDPLTNGHLALNVCSVGFDARIGLGAGDFKGLPFVSGTMAYQLSAVRAILQGIHRPYRVSIDGEELPGGAFTLMCACNGRYYGGGFNPSRTAMPDDGLLDFVVIPAVSRLTVVSLIGKYAKEEWGSIESHQMLMNVSMLGMEKVVEIIEGMYREG